MKKIFLLLGIICSMSIFGQERVTNINGSLFKGKVKSCTMTTYTAECGIDGNLVLDNNSKEYAFDKEGNLIELANTDSIDTCKYAYTYISGNMTEEIMYDNSELSKKFSYEYDKYGRLINENTYDVDGTIKWSEYYSYDAHGNKISTMACTVYDKDCPNSTCEYDTLGGTTIAVEQQYLDDNLIWKYVYTYNDKGQITVKAYYEKNAIQWSYNYRYNNDGKCVEMAQYGSSNKLWWKVNYDYDKNGNVISKIFYKANGMYNGQIYYKFNKNNQLLKEVSYDEHNKVKYVKKIQYNSKGFEKRIEYVSYKNGEANKEFYEYEYEYDAFGNWISKYEFLNSQINKLYKQDIIYYTPDVIQL